MEYRMYDTHMHLIPGVDDGATDFNMAQSILETAMRQGICGIFATPHSSAFFQSPQDVMENYILLRERIKRCCADFELYLGCEVYCEKSDMAEVLPALLTGRLPTLNGTKYVLTEYAPRAKKETVLYCAEKLLAAGFLPVIAHAERYYFLQDNFYMVKKLKDMGCRIQINVYSVYEEHDAGIKACANRLVSEHLADFLGSDAHRTGHRPPCVETGLRYLYEIYEKTYIDRIALENPRRLLTGQDFPA